MQLPIVEPAPVVLEHTLVFRDLSLSHTKLGYQYHFVWIPK